jgi:hypothetical protein
MEEDNYEEFEDETEDSEELLLSIGEDDKASIHKPEDYVEVLKIEAELVRDFIDANKNLFDAFVKKRNEVKPNSSHD